MTVPASTYNITNMNTAAGASQYKAQIDADSSVNSRIGAIFAPHQGTVGTLNVYLDPGFILNGASLIEQGTRTTATFTSGATTATVENPSGISGTMWISDNVNNTLIAAGTTCTISGFTLTLSTPTLASGTDAQVTIGQISPAIVAPVSNSRIDRIVVSAITGAVSVITGTADPTPTPPALTAGVLPVAQVLLATSTTSILNSVITDERAFSGSSTNETEATIASATTTDLGAANVNNSAVTGTATITSFGSNGNLANPYYRVRFTGACTITYNGTSLILPNGVNIVTIAGDYATFQYMGSGNWRLASYSRASGALVNSGPVATIAGASTTDLGSTGKTLNIISGTATITSFGSSATVDNALYYLTFSGASILTYNATSLILPGLVNITTAANDTAVAQFLGSGNWQIVSYTKAAGAAAVSIKHNTQASTYAPTATDLSQLVDFTGSANATWTMTSAATLGNGWFCYLRNNGTSNAQLLLKSSSGTIDGIAAGTGYVMYAGECRIITSDGTNFTTVIVNPGLAVFTANDTFLRPPGYTSFFVEGWGGGASGSAGGASNYCAGGGGGAYNSGTFSAAAIGSSQSVTVGATAAAVTTASVTTTVGHNGNQSSFGSLVTFYAGGGASITIGYGGGGGGGQAGNSTGLNGGLGVLGGTVTGVTAGGTSAVSSVYGGGGGTSSTAAAGSSVYGGGGGGGANSVIAWGAGNSVYGGAGGGVGVTGSTTPGGTSNFGGAGGAGVQGTGLTAGSGTVPGGGGGGSFWVTSGTSTSGAGARGEVRVHCTV